MPSLTIKNLPRDVHEALRRRAREHRRSLNQEILGILASEATRVPFDVEAFLSSVRADQRRRAWPPLTDRELRIARRAGRP
jgi:plasmid stability protein